jgi:hypothetical protein
MKLCLLNSAAFVVFGFLLASDTPGNPPDAKLTPSVKQPWQATQRAASRTEWSTITIHTNWATGRLLVHTNTFTELGAGLNVRNGAGQFVAADPTFQITADGAESKTSSHKLIVPADIWLGDGIKVIKPDGQQLVFQPLGIDYYDPTDGRSVLVDAVTNTIGWLTASNEIVFSNCLTRIKASIRIRNFNWGIESDLIFHERPPDPSSVGLSAAARLEMLTEQFDGPSPDTRSKFLHRETNPAKLATMVEPHFVDSELSFGGMKMPLGKAFGTGQRTNGPAMLPNPVGKTFGTIQERRIIIEAIEHRHALPALEKLPAAVRGMTNAALNLPLNGNVFGNVRQLPALANALVRQNEKARRSASIRRAKPPVSNGANQSLLSSLSQAETPAFVLDYQLVNENGETDFTFRGDTTFLVTSLLPLYGITTIEGGSVIKFYDGTGLYLQPGSTIVCDTTNWLPCVLTSADDNSVGETIPGSSGTPWQMATPALNFYGGSYELRNLRFKHIGNPVQAENSVTITARNTQFVDVYAPFAFNGSGTLNVFNALAKDIFYFYYGDAVTFRGEHLTLHNGYILGDVWSPGNSSATLRNSLLVAIESAPNVGPYTPLSTVSLSSDSGVFQTLEGGAHYLPANSPQRSVAAASGIDGQLKSSLEDMTTYASTLLTGTVQSDLTLMPLLPRDSQTIGFHYPAVDYLAKDLTLHNNAVTLGGGVTVATTASANWAAISLSPSKIVSVGTPTRMNRILRANQVQENESGRSAAMLASGNSDTFKPELTFRFTDLSSLAGEQFLVYMAGDYTRLQACHSTFFNGWIQLSMYGGIYQTVGVTNNLFRSVAASFTGTSPVYFYAYNNLFKAGAASFTGGNSTWRIQYNVFDHATVSRDASAFSANKNGYVGLSHALGEIGYTELASLTYANGPLGRHYLPGSTFQDAGTDLATALGLYHFTTRANQVKEVNSAVDYGFHYVAVDSLGMPLDFDQDGIPDYLEDTNGNGTYAAGSDLSDWTDPDTDHDLLPDGWEYKWFGNPFSAIATADQDGDGLTNLQEYQLNLDPTVNQSAQGGSRKNYIYDRLNRVQTVTGVGPVNLILDREGNITNVTP